MIFCSQGRIKMCDVEFYTQLCNALRQKKSPEQKSKIQFYPGRHTKIPGKAPVPVRHLFNMYCAEKEALTKLKMIKIIMSENSDHMLSNETMRKMDLIGKKIEVILNLIDVIVLEKFPKIILSDDENIIVFEAWDIGYRQ